MSESYEFWPANYVWRSSRPTRSTPPPTDPYGPVVTGELRDESQVVMSPRSGERLEGIGPVSGLQAFRPPNAESACGYRHTGPDDDLSEITRVGRPRLDWTAQALWPPRIYSP
jgi:hypothetical protein